MERFDRHEWNPGFYETAEEIETALESFGVKDKEISGINIIGIAQNMIPWSYTQRMRRTLAKVGVPYEDIDSGKYPVDTALLPREVTICEPVVVLFTDGSTFEVMAKEGKGLLMSINQISPHVIDGTNDHNFDAKNYFKCLNGNSIDHVQVIERVETNMSGHSSYQEIRRDKTFRFCLKRNGKNGPQGFFIQQSRSGWYQFGIANWSTMDNSSTVAFSEVKATAANNRQVEIVEGHDSGGYFWIMPVRPSEEARFGMEEYREEEISIDELDISAFLQFFLHKYFDDSFPYQKYCPYRESNHFEWNLEYNLYSYDTVDLMLQDIEECAELFEHEFENPYLDYLKHGYKWYNFAPGELNWLEKPNEKEAMNIIKDNIHIATDLYRRFAKRVRAMMENAPDYEYISFMGP